MYKKVVLFCVVTLFSCAVALAQGIKVSGVVVGAEDGEPVAGASVIAKGTTVGVATSLDGEFAFEMPAGVKEIQVSFIGYETQIVTATTRRMRIELVEEGQDLEEVVVMAYGSTTSKNLTGAVSSVRGDALRDVPGSSVDGMLQGRASGVMINATTSSVGVAPIINIRGVSSISNSTQPLYVVDGMIYGMSGASSTRSNPLADLNPADIKSIDILKDAAATALYGSRAANGVILITTNGNTQGKAKVSYSGAFAINQATKMFDVMNAEEYTNFKNLGIKNTADRLGGDEGAAFYEKWKYGLQYYTKESGVYATTDQGLGYADTNWIDLLFQTGKQQTHDVNIQGGNENSTYYVSAGYMDMTGITVKDSFSRFTFNANFNSKLNRYVKIGFNGSFTNSEQNNVDGGYGGGVYYINGFSRLATCLPPNITARHLDGTPYQDNGKNFGYGNNNTQCTYFNPLTYIEDQVSHMDNNRVRANGYVDITPIKGLTLRSQFGIDWFFTQSNTLRSPFGGDGYDSKGAIYNYDGTRKTWTWTNTATYNFDIKKKNHFSLMAGTEAQEMIYHRRNFNGETLMDTEMIYPEAGYATYSGGGSRSERAIASYLSRVTWNWNYRYYLEASFRRDGLSSLGKKWGNFWGTSASWRISDEKFFKPLKSVLTDFRLKASYGIVGNTSISGGDYAAYSLYSSSYYNGLGAIYLSSIADPNLGWEQTAKTDIGVTGTLFGKYKFELTYFNSTSKDLVLNSSQSYSTGIPGSKITTNMGKAENKGVEFSIGGTIIQKGKFTWDSNFNFTFVKNKVLDLESDIVPTDNAASNITFEGSSMARLYLYPSGGVDRETGRRIVYLDDANGDPTRKAYLVYTYGKGGAKVYDYQTNEQLSLNDWNPHVMGGTKPTYYGGWQNTFRYKEWDVTCFFQFSGGNKIYNGMKATMSDNRFWNNSRDMLKHAWRNPGDKATYAKPEYSDNYSNGSQNALSDWMEDGDYLRMKNLGVGYTFNTRNWSRSIGISKLRIYASATNLFCITSYSGMDPEMSALGSLGNLTSGIDKNSTPLTRTYSFGLNLTF